MRLLSRRWLAPRWLRRLGASCMIGGQTVAAIGRGDGPIRHGEDLVAARASAAKTAAWLKQGLPVARGRGQALAVESPLVLRHPWDLFRLAPAAIAAEAAASDQPTGPGPGFSGAAFIDRP